MPQQFIHVKIGLTDGIYPVREFITTGLMHDMYEFQQDEHTIGWVHKHWCTPVSAPQALSGGVPCHGLQAVDSALTSSTLSSAVQLLHTSTNKIMSKIKIKVTINMEHMSHDEQMRYFIRLADMGLLPPCPPEIRRKYEKPTDK